MRKRFYKKKPHKTADKQCRESCMADNAHSMYLESKILSADPVELVQILYRTAVESVERAREYLKQRDIHARTKEINKTIAILSELSASLNHDAVGSFIS